MTQSADHDHDPVRVGLIGCGLNMRQTHAPRLLQTPGAVIAALCDPDPSALVKL